LLIPRDAPPAWRPLPAVGDRSGRLEVGLRSPLPGGRLSGYSADTGLDIAGFKLPVHAIAAGVIEYAEAGHTRWTSRRDAPYTVRLRLDEPIPWGEHRITHAYYGHLSALAQVVHEGESPPWHVEAGQKLGVSGWANGSPHLHLGLILDGHVAQDSWVFLLDEAEVRQALGGMRNGNRLP
jgi:murein DD-endopeptidase MepM/ murein hydrolase activator NlpD